MDMSQFANMGGMGGMMGGMNGMDMNAMMAGMGNPGAMNPDGMNFGVEEVDSDDEQTPPLEENE